MLTNRISLCYTLATTAIFGALFGFINSAQQIYVGIYGLGVWFPVIFACVAGMMAVSSFVNSRLVGRFGMRRLSHGALLGFIAGQQRSGSCSSLFGQLPLCVFVPLFAAGDAAVRLDRLELQLDRHGAARPPRRHRPRRSRASCRRSAAA